MQKGLNKKNIYLERFGPWTYSIRVAQKTLTERGFLTLANEQEKCQETRRGEKVTVKDKPNLPTVSKKPPGKLRVRNRDHNAIKIDFTAW